MRLRLLFVALIASAVFVGSAPAWADAIPTGANSGAASNLSVTTTTAIPSAASADGGSGNLGPAGGSANADSGSISTTSGYNYGLWFLLSGVLFVIAVLVIIRLSRPGPPRELQGRSVI